MLVRLTAIPPRIRHLAIVEIVDANGGVYRAPKGFGLYPDGIWPQVWDDQDAVSILTAGGIRYVSDHVVLRYGVRLVRTQPSGPSTPHEVRPATPLRPGHREMWEALTRQWQPLPFVGLLKPDPPTKKPKGGAKGKGGRTRKPDSRYAEALQFWDDYVAKHGPGPARTVRIQQIWSRYPEWRNIIGYDDGKPTKRFRALLNERRDGIKDDTE